METTHKKGFTLIELLVVISIIGLLSSIVLSSLSDARKKARDTAKIRAVLEMRTALQMYFSDNGSYPLTFPVVIPKYISVRTYPESIYQPTSDSAGSLTCVATGCQSYYLGIPLEDRNNSILKNDINLTIGGFYGNLDTCAAGGNQPAVGTNNLCFGVKP
jgi:prepilin-type N-terminal cleavage/methylation domain-containing protein